MPALPSASFASLSPAVQAHLVFAVAALLLGPWVLWRSRKGSRAHRLAGYAWVVLMLGTALSSVFIRDFRLPNLAGYTPIHLFTAMTLVMVPLAVRDAVRGQVAAHQKAMRKVYLGACVVAGLFTLLPGRYLGTLLWHHTLGWV